MNESRVEDKEAVKTALVGFLGTIEAQDIEAVLAAHSSDYRDGQGSDKAARRSYFENLFATGVLENAEFDTTDLDVTVEGDVATAAPVTYRMSAGTANFEYELKKDPDGVWRILGSVQIPAVSARAPSARPAETSAIESNAGRSFLADAGRQVDRHAMVWIRRFDSPIEQVWETVSTIEGLKKWWVVPPSKFELKKGGAFNHHWNNTIADFEENAFIDFTENTGNYSTTGGMRFELSKIDDDTTMFMFLDTWGPDMTPPPSASSEAGEQPGGPGTPWAGVAAGWHSMVDKLEHVIDGRKPDHTYEELQTLYVGYLRDLHRWNAMVKRTAQR